MTAAFDEARGETVVVAPGGTSTWLWAGQSWREVTWPEAPSLGVGHGVAYDWLRGRLVLFGGQSHPGPALPAVTWEWNGHSWSSSSPSTTPSARSQASLGFDATRGQVVLFGGQTVGSFGAPGPSLSDTWLWDGQTWAQRTVAVAPSARFGSAMAFDRVRQRLVLFGGKVQAQAQPLTDTWEWDGSQWLARVPTTVPAWPMTRFSGASISMTWNPDAARVVLLMCSTGQSAPRALWSWDGVDWVPGLAPPECGSLTFDETGHQLVVVVPTGRVIELTTAGWVVTTPTSSDGFDTQLGTSVFYDGQAHQLMTVGSNGLWVMPR